MDSTLRSQQAFARFVRSAPLAVVATVGPAGTPQAALVEITATDDGDLVLTTTTPARKVSNIGDGARVAVVVGCTGPVSLQVEGHATVETGPARVEAGTIYIEAFPGSRALYEGFSVIRVRPDWIRQYDVGTDPPAVEEGRPAWAGNPGTG